MAQPNHNQGDDVETTSQRQQEQHQAVLAQQRALNFQAYQQYNSQVTSQRASHPQAYYPQSNQRSVSVQSLLTLPGIGTFDPVPRPDFNLSPGGFLPNAQPYPYPPPLPSIESFDPQPRPGFNLAPAPPAQVTPASSGGSSMNAQTYPPGLPSLQSIFPRPQPGFPPAPPRAQPASARNYTPPAFPPPLVAPPVEIPPTSSAGSAANTQIYPRPALSSWAQFPDPTNTLQIRYRPPPPPPSAAPQSRTTITQAQHLQNLQRQIKTGAKQHPKAKHTSQEKPKSTEKHPHTEPRMCKRMIRTFEGCPCVFTDIKSCKDEKLVLKDSSALVKCEAFQEVTRNSPANCGGKGDHWACPAKLRFWSERKVEWQDGSFIWV